MWKITTFRVKPSQELVQFDWPVIENSLINSLFLILLFASWILKHDVYEW